MGIMNFKDVARPQKHVRPNADEPVGPGAVRPMVDASGSAPSAPTIGIPGVDLVVREAREADLAQIGALTAGVYADENLAPPEYCEVLRDARSRWKAPATTLLVAHEGKAEEPQDILGSIVYAAPGSPWQEIMRDDDAEFRMLAVAATARGRGIGEALVRACIDRARREGSPRIGLSTSLDMRAAQRLYERLGFVRVPELDWYPLPDTRFVLRGYALTL